MRLLTFAPFAFSVALAAPGERKELEQQQRQLAKDVRSLAGGKRMAGNGAAPAGGLGGGMGGLGGPPGGGFPGGGGFGGGGRGFAPMAPPAVPFIVREYAHSVPTRNEGQDRTDFTVTVSPQDMRAFRQAKFDVAAMQGKRVRVRGWVESYNGPEMEIATPAAIELLAAE